MASACQRNADPNSVSLRHPGTPLFFEGPPRESTTVSRVTPLVQLSVITSVAMLLSTLQKLIWTIQDTGTQSGLSVGQGTAAFPTSLEPSSESPRTTLRDSPGTSQLQPISLRVGVLSLLNEGAGLSYCCTSDRMIYYLVGQGMGRPANICGMSPLVFSRGPLTN